ncbi:MAG: YbaB/EbfC family nucleoid-associated protein [Christensenellales bacterium]
MSRGGFPGMGGGANIQQLMRQAQKMQQDMQKVQEELETLEFEASSGGGMVSVVVTGKKEVKKVTIKPEAVDPDDVEMLEDMVAAAVNEAIRKAEEKVNAEMAKISGGLPMGGMF